MDRSSPSWDSFFSIDSLSFDLPSPARNKNAQIPCPYRSELRMEVAYSIVARAGAMVCEISIDIWDKPWSNFPIEKE